METATMPRARRASRNPEDVRSEQKVTTFTPGDSRRLELLAAKEDRSTAWLLHKATLKLLEEAGIVDDGVRPAPPK